MGRKKIKDVRKKYFEKIKELMDMRIKNNKMKVINKDKIMEIG
jgi:hypothetical protein